MGKKEWLIIAVSAVVVAALLVATLRLTGFASVVSNTSVDVCQDSDAGADIFQRGVVTGVASNSIGTGKAVFSKEDTCLDKRTLIEYSCTADGENYHAVAERYSCENGCLNGACIGSGS